MLLQMACNEYCHCDIHLKITLPFQMQNKWFSTENSNGNYAVTWGFTRIKLNWNEIKIKIQNWNCNSVIVLNLDNISSGCKDKVSRMFWIHFWETIVS